jgi:hypothetical protein
MYGQLPDKKHMPPTKVFAIAGLDGRAISSKSLISYSSGWTLLIKRQNVSSTIKQ